MKSTLESKVDQLINQQQRLISLLESLFLNQTVSVKKAAELFGCCEQLIRNGIHSGDIPATQVNRHYEIPYSFVAERISNQNANTKKQ